MPDVLDEVETLTRQHERIKAECDAKVAQAAAERDNAIRRAIEERKSRAEIIARSRLSPARIEQIKRRTR